MSYFGDGSSLLTGSSCPYTTLEGRSISVWVKFASLNANEGIIGFRNSSTGSSYSVYFNNNTDTIDIERFHSGVAASKAVSPANVVVDTWHHVVITIGAAGDSTIVTLDGVAGVENTTLIQPPGMDTFELFETLSSSESDDHIAEVALYDKILSGSEITDLAGGDNPQDFSDLDHYWPMKTDLAADVGSITFSATGTITQDADHPTISAPSGGGDTTPDAFSFTDQTSVAKSSTMTSAAITVAGIDTAAAITVTGGTYDINASGTFVSTAGTVNNGDTVRARHTSSSSNSTATNTVVTIGGVSDTFTSTTLASTATVTTAAITGGASLTALEWAVFSSQDLSSATLLDQGSGETTNGSGVLVLDITGSGATNSQSVWYVIKNTADTIAAQGPATVVVT